MCWSTFYPLDRVMRSLNNWGLISSYGHLQPGRLNITSMLPIFHKQDSMDVSTELITVKCEVKITLFQDYFTCSE